MIKKFGIIYAVLVTQLIASPFTIVSSEGGVTIYKKKFSNGSIDYVQEIDLSKGAKIKLLVGEVDSIEYNYGDNKGDKSWIRTQSIKESWNNSINENKNTECIINGEYFGKKKYTRLSTLSYPVKIDGEIYDGSSSIYKKYQKVLNINNENVSMEKFDSLKNMRNWDSSIVGLDTSLKYGGNKQAEKRKGRTYIGILDKNKDKINETILIYSSKYANQKDAKDTLISFGAISKNIMMLDGGGSSQLICNGKNFVKSSRKLPQFIATIKGESQDLSYEDKVNFVFDGLEKKHSFYFPKGSKTEKYQGNFYRTYNVRGKYHTLYAYNKKIYYNVGSGYKLYYTVDAWYNYLNK
jgi:hypothetical protein